jgi:hypothetical protein
VDIDLIVAFARVAATVFVSELRLRRDDQRAMRQESVEHWSGDHYFAIGLGISILYQLRCGLFLIILSVSLPTPQSCEYGRVILPCLKYSHAILHNISIR